jgi:hypothetical protein
VAQHLAMACMQLLSLVFLQFVPHSSGEEKAYVHTPSLFISFFIGLAASHLIHSFALMAMVSTRACDPW